MHGKSYEDDVHSNTQSEHRLKNGHEYFYSNFTVLRVFSMTILRTDINSKVVHTSNFTTSDLKPKKGRTKPT